MEVSSLLIGIGTVDQFLLLKGGGKELKADGQSLSGETTRYRDSRQTSKVTGNGEDIRKIHLEWVFSLFPQFKGWGRGSRGNNKIAFLKRLFKILPNQCPSL